MIDRTGRDAARLSFAENPLVASVLRENVHVIDGRAIIGLWGNWPALLGEIPNFGNVLAITRNSHAVLGRISNYPEVALTPCGHHGCAVDDSIEFDFTRWRRAVAMVEARPSGWLYAIEFSDFSREVVHKICLTEESDFEAFRSWVELSQTAAESTRGCTSSRHASWLENTMLLAESGAERLRVEALCVFFQMAGAERSGFRAIVGNDGAAQVAPTSPRIFRRSGQWIFSGDETSGIHVRIDRLAEVYLQNLGESLVLKACDPEGRLMCVLAAPHNGDLRNWNAKLRGLAKDFPTEEK